MTNVDFFRDFAAETTMATVKTDAYYFEHDTEMQAIGNFMQSTGTNDTQKKMFHFTYPEGIIPIQNDSDNTTGVKYRGECLVLVQADPGLPVDVQGGIAENTGRYTANIKDMVDQGEILRQLREYATQLNITALAAGGDNTYYTIRIQSVTEVYGQMGFYGDGIAFKYELTIKHDTN